MAATAFSTDLYQLTMMAGYVAAGRHETPATFELFVRRLPRNRAVLVAAGLEQALDYVEALRFTPDDIAWLREQPPFAGISAGFFEYLERFRFTGDLFAMPEGTPFFPNEPILRVTAPLAEAQLLETALLAQINFQTSIASKAIRAVHAAAGKPVMEFGARRAHGVDAAFHAARAAHIGGCSATSYVDAGRRFGIPLSGTMAHSWVLAADSERQAFEEYEGLFGANTALLLDTYDVAAAARLVVEAGLQPPAVRIDSGDLGALAREVRGIFDAGGLRETRILVSGDLDEWQIRDLESAGAPIDGYAVGTALTTSEDAPALGGVYKLVALGVRPGSNQGQTGVKPGSNQGQTGVKLGSDWGQTGVRLGSDWGQTGVRPGFDPSLTPEWRPVMKRSAGKATWPGAKQVWRAADHDVVALADEPHVPGARPLLEPAIRQGARVAPRPPIGELRDRCRALLDALPAALRNIDSGGPRYRVHRSAALDLLMR